METLNEGQALALVVEAIKSGAIKLQGPAGSSDKAGAERAGECDATYVLSLLTKLRGA